MDASSVGSRAKVGTRIGRAVVCLSEVRQVRSHDHVGGPHQGTGMTPADLQASTGPRLVVILAFDFLATVNIRA